MNRPDHAQIVPQTVMAVTYQQLTGGPMPADELSLPFQPDPFNAQQAGARRGKPVAVAGFKGSQVVKVRLQRAGLIVC